ncbi:MAG: DNA-3-methyladenine glycosylase [Phycisphaeraceae bacterium]|nr:MAG: DNA-3-methyladenine glycosylase [Phycisphaeraceae bacterium]
MSPAARTRQAWTAPDIDNQRWPREMFRIDAAELSQRLLGRRLVRILDGGERLSGRIVETEAYLGAQDLAAHCAGNRRTPRNESMYGPPGIAYVYFTYGMHHCVNVVCAEEGSPAAALIRALAPEEGLDRMRHNRTGPRRASPLRDHDLCSGPAKLCQALAIDRALDSADLVNGDRLFIEGADAGSLFEQAEIANAARIGVDSAGSWAKAPLRWYVKHCPHVSRD